MTITPNKYEGKKILVVEDDNISRTLFREIFKKTSCKLEYAKNAAEATAYIESNPAPDLILMDIRLPDNTGLELTKELKAKNPNLVVVAQTAFAYQNLEEDCLEAGMLEFLTKPIQQSKVFGLLNKLGW